MPDPVNGSVRVTTEAEAFPPLRGVRRAASWLAYHAVTRWPLSVERRGIGRVYWGLLPWAGLWAYHPDGGDA